MIIAMSTNDRENIVKRTGRAKEFAIYDLETMKPVYKKNTHKHHDHSHDEGETHSHSHDEIVSLFKEYNVDAIVVEMMGANFKGELNDSNIKIYKVNTENKNLEFIASKFKENPEEFTILK